MKLHRILKTHRFTLRLLASLMAAASTVSAPANPPTAASPSLRWFKLLPAGASTYTNVPGQVAYAVPTGPATAPRTTVAYSKQHRCWLEVRPDGPVTIQSVRAALAKSEVIFEAEEAQRQYAADQECERQRQERMAKEKANAERREVWSARMASQPRGDGWALLAGQASGTVVTTTCQTTQPPPPQNSSCIRQQLFNYATGRGPLPKGVTNVRITRTPACK